MNEYHRAVEELNNACRKQLTRLWLGLGIFWVMQMSVIVFLDYRGVI